MSQPKYYLACFVVNHDTVRVPCPPLEELSLVVPSLSAGSDSRFEILTVKNDGSVERNREAHGCQFTSVSITFPSASLSSVNADMELEEAEIVEANVSLRVFRTIPYPDKQNRSLVLLSGRVTVTSESESLICVLPEYYRPREELKFACNNRDDYVTVFPDGRLLSDTSSPTPSEISLDNIRFFAGDAGSDIKSRFPYRSQVHALDPSKSTQSRAGRQSDLYFPVTIKYHGKAGLGVAVLTQSGDFILLGGDDEEADGALEVLSGAIPVSSLITCTVPNANFSPSQLIASLKDEEWAEFKDLVGQKLSTLVFSALTGESALRCDKRDRFWRQTGQKKNT
jgi:hypothetical protein